MRLPHRPGAEDPDPRGHGTIGMRL
ncbi:hypothetical protein CURTO8I2_100061 [Curtobacterium sp. 8I-2]|nr:hypothetical protein CURTO8I2_100061 [Curtobacterium sp. 8I-2]